MAKASGYPRFNCVALGALLLCVPAAAHAQSVISGQVRDSTGLVLPGVSVEASSPALIERSRTVVTDEQGRYSLVNLRPGRYAILFSLPGFESVRNEGVELASDITVPINVVLKIGSVAEAITVSGATPLVDVQVAARTQVLTKELTDALPTARTYGTVGVIVPGVKLTKPDMGGTQAVQQAYVIAHGMTANDNGMQVDSLNTKPNNDAGNQHYPNFGMMQEVSYQTSAIGADTSSGGVRINMIPRDGGNRFSGDIFFGGSNGAWQADNITRDLIQRGLKTPTGTDYLYDFNPGFGGPIVRDRLWFYASARRLVLNSKPAGAVLDDGAQAIEDQYVNNGSARLTYQITPGNKLTLYKDRQWKGKGHDYTDTTGADARITTPGIATSGTSRRRPQVYYIALAKWTDVISSKLLMENGISINVYNYTIDYQTGVAQPRGSASWHAGAPRIDVIYGTLTNASNFPPRDIKADGYTASSTVSYVTGSHNFRTGWQWRFGPSEEQYDRNADLTEYFRAGVADSVVVFSTPVHTKEYINADLGLFVQDSWTVNRLTVSPGVRFEYLNGSIRDSVMPPGRFVGARSVTTVGNLPNWFDVAPRLSAVYDLFGNAKTAIKGSASKFMQQYATGYPTRYNPAVLSSDTRNWTDLNGDRIAQDNEIGPSNTRNFGLLSNRHPAEDLRRPYNWEYTFSLQQQVLPRVSLSTGWYRRQFRLVEGQYNTLVSIGDYAAFRTTSPLDGQPITIFNLNPSKQGQVEIIDRNSAINRRTYTGYDVSVTARLAKGGLAQGGWAMERTIGVTCDTSNPNLLRFCDQSGALYQELGAVKTVPFRHEFKLAAAYPFGWGMQGSLSLLSFPGETLGVNWTVPASAFPNGQRTQAVVVPLVQPNTTFLDRWNQLDVGVRKTVKVAGSEWQGSVEIFNLLNSSVVLGQNQNFGTALGTPASTLQGRLLRLSVHVKF